MKFSLDFYIVCNNDAILDGIMQKVPSKLDGKVWQEGYDFYRGITFEGNKCLSGSIRFNAKIDRQTIFDNIKNSVTPAILSQILTGSFINIHSCNHDESSVMGCVSTRVWSK